MKFLLIGRYKLVIGLAKIVVDGQLKTQTSSFTALRRRRMIKKIWGIICWPWNRFVKWLASGLPKGKNER